MAYDSDAPKYNETNDAYGIKSINYKSGSPVKFWDEGFGPLWIYQSADFDFGIIRCWTFQEAYECVEDEILPRATHEDIARDFPNYGEYESMTAHEQACFDEAYGMSGNNGYYHKPMNGEVLRPLTGKDCLEHELCIKWEFNG